MARRARRTKNDIELIDAALVEFAFDERPVTVRQCFYHLVSRGLIAKEEGEYDATGKRLTKLRKSGAIPYEWIADNTRCISSPYTSDSISHELRRTALVYRRALWTNQPNHVLIGLEKDALSGVVGQVTQEYDVDLMVARGYPSLSVMKQMADNIKEADRPSFVYYFGDHDPSGVDIPRHIQSTLWEFGCEFEFVRAAVTEDQITELELPTRPTKKTDTRAKGWKGGSVDLDAIPPSTLRQMVRDVIEPHIDRDLWEETLAKETEERAMLEELAGQWEARLS